MTERSQTTDLGTTTKEASIHIQKDTSDKTPEEEITDAILIPSISITEPENATPSNLNEETDLDKPASPASPSPVDTPLQNRIALLEAELEAQTTQVHHYYTLATQYEFKWKATAKQLLHLRQPATPLTKVDDALIIQQYSHIRYLIRTFTVKYFSVAQKSSNYYVGSREPKLDALKFLTDQYKVYWKTRALLPVIVQAFLFSKLLSLRSSARLLWAGGQIESFRSLSKALQPVSEMAAVPRLIREGIVEGADVQTYQTWRASTASLLAKQVERADVVHLVDGLVGRLCGYLGAWASGKDQGMGEELREVVWRVVELDEVIFRSRAIVIPQLWYSSHRGQRYQYGFEFGEDMESEDGFEEAQRGMTVELVVSPGLFKIGNGDGGGYDSMSTLSMGSVVCISTRESMMKSGRLK